MPNRKNNFEKFFHHPKSMHCTYLSHFQFRRVFQQPTFIVATYHTYVDTRDCIFLAKSLVFFSHIFIFGTVRLLYTYMFNFNYCEFRWTFETIGWPHPTSKAQNTLCTIEYSPNSVCLYTQQQQLYLWLYVLRHIFALFLYYLWVF